MTRKRKSKQTAAETFDISKAEATVRADLQSATETRADLLAQFASGADVAEELDTIDEEIASHKRALERFDEMREAAAKVNTRGARQARHDRVRDELDAAITAARDTGEQAKEVLVAIAGLGGALQLLQDKHDGAAAHLRAALQQSYAGVEERRVEDLLNNSRRALAQLMLTSNVVAAMFIAGIGRVGVRSDHITVTPLKTNNEPHDEITTAIAKLSDTAEQIVAWSERSNLKQEAA